MTALAILTGAGTLTAVIAVILDHRRSAARFAARQRHPSARFKSEAPRLERHATESSQPDFAQWERELV